jgi:hypothetical protein
MNTIVSAFVSNVNNRYIDSITQYYELGKPLLISSVPKIIFVDKIMLDCIGDNYNKTKCNVRWEWCLQLFLSLKCKSWYLQQLLEVNPKCYQWISQGLMLIARNSLRSYLAVVQEIKSSSNKLRATKCSVNNYQISVLTINFNKVRWVKLTNQWSHSLTRCQQKWFKVQEKWREAAVKNH